jgi:HPt (histidine-containing phosphotransfer) domain-containing protein
MLKKLFGKYRFLVVSIALFLILDLGVLALNFYTSGKIAEQTERINLAGRQRTLTQQMSKATLYIKAQKLQAWVYQSGLGELRDHYTVFGDTIRAFNEGGKIRSAQTGNPIFIEPVDTVEGREILAAATQLWSDFDAAISPLMVDILVTDEEIESASAFIAATNLAMFDLMNQLTEHFTRESEAQTSMLRRVQVTGIALATLNFFVILFHFLGQLRGRDRKLEVKQHESDQILSTIDEGVFLLDEELVIGGQHSRSLRRVFATRHVAKRRFGRFLSVFFSEKVVKAATDYASLYFQAHINPDLIGDVNPLKRVSATVALDSGEVEKKFLDFSFAPLRPKGEKKMLLVTVRDVTDSILLEEQSEQRDIEIEQQLALFSQILPIDPADLEAFIRESVQGLERFNELLKRSKKVNDNFEKTLTRMLRESHKLKGNASALGFEWMSAQVHNFEGAIESLRQQGERKILRGQDLLPLTIQLKQLYDSMEMVNQLRERLRAYGIKHGNSTTSETMVSAITNEPLENRRWFALRGLVKKMARSEDIEVELRLRGFNEPLDAELTQKLYPLAVQLVRNSVVHGIEGKPVRRKLKKPNSGQICLSLSNDGKHNYRLILEDDGRGFDYPAIRKAMIEKGLVTETEAKKMSKTKLIQRTFSGRFSTRNSANVNAGRGVGLALVWEQVRALEGNLKVRSVEHEFTQFIIDFTHVEGDGRVPVLTKSVA